MLRKTASWWKKQSAAMKSAIVGALIGGIFTIIAVLLPDKPLTTVVVIAPTPDHSTIPTFAPFTPIVSTQVTPIVITPFGGDVDSQLLAAWENAQIMPNTSNNVVEVIERNDSKIVLLVEAKEDGNGDIDWRISSKKAALELLAAYTASQFDNQEIAKYCFVHGSINQAYFDDDRKIVIIRFTIYLKEE